MKYIFCAYLIFILAPAGNLFITPVHAGEADAAAIHQQAENYYRGKTVPKDTQQAVKLYTQAAELGYPKAQNMLAYLYEAGVDVEKDLPKAISLYRQAAEAGYPTAQFNLAQKYQSGIGVEKDDKQAFQWCEKAARAGQKNAMLRLSEYYMHGTGVRKNYPLSYAWFQMAFESGAFVPMGMQHTLRMKMDYMQSIEAENQVKKLRAQLSKDK